MLNDVKVLGFEMRSILVILLFIFGSAAQAKEIIMACGTTTYKYQKPFLRSPKVSVMHADESQYRPFCTSDKEPYRSIAKLYFNDLTVTCDDRKVLPSNGFFGLHILRFDKLDDEFKSNTKEFSSYKRCDLLTK